MTEPEPHPPTSFDLAFTGAGLVCIAASAAMSFGDFAFGARINGWQDGLMGGRHFPFFTLMILSIASVIPVFIVKAVVARAR
ncbi:MAG: hypothetical protein ACOYN0_16430 [Phycisphaerales bacterium]|jgi:hypothetical protein